MQRSKICLPQGASSVVVQGGCPQKSLGRDSLDLAVEDTECYFEDLGGLFFCLFLFFFFFLLK